MGKWDVTGLASWETLGNTQGITREEHMPDLLSLLREKVDSASIKRVSGSKGGEYHSPCPLCGGTDRFLVFPEQEGGELCRKHGIPGTWSCPRGCGKGGDVIGFLREVSGLSFKAACAELGIESDKNRRAYRPLRGPAQQAEPAFIPRQYQEPPDIWKAQAAKLVGEAHENLLRAPSVLSWLARRGLPEDAARAYRLGYLAGEGKNEDCLYRARSAFGLPDKPGKNSAGKALRIPRGVTIPAFGRDGSVCRLRIRRRNSDLRGNAKLSKYLLIPQPEPWSAPMALPPAAAPDMATWVIVESELDAMAVHHACGGAVGVLSVLSVSGKPDVSAHRCLRRSVRILLALDFDQDKADGGNPGASAWPWWERTYPQARLWPVPEGKDPGEAFERGVDLRDWAYAGMPKSCPSGTGTGKRSTAVSVSLSGGYGQVGSGKENSAVASDGEKPEDAAARRGYADIGLFHPLSPADALRIISGAGLEAVPVSFEGEDDFAIRGHEKWEPEDVTLLFGWLRRHGEWVLRALYAEELPDVDGGIESGVATAIAPGESGGDA